MSEPAEVAPVVEEVVDGLWHWRIENAAIGGGLSSSHALRVEDDRGAGCVLVDPVRLDPHALQQLPTPRAIVLTSRGHQRAAWRYRGEFDVPVWAPSGVTGTDEDADEAYAAGDELPGGMIAVHTPGPEQAHFSLHVPTLSAVIVSDLVSNDGSGALALIPAELHEDPEATRHSVGILAALEPDLVLLAHGAPVRSGGGDALRAAVTEPN